jgi:hypothetical protein
VEQGATDDMCGAELGGKGDTVCTALANAEQSLFEFLLTTKSRMGDSNISPPTHPGSLVAGGEQRQLPLLIAFEH